MALSRATDACLVIGKNFSILSIEEIHLNNFYSGVASNSSQCDDHSGECACKPGVGGRQCNRCLPGFWNYGQGNYDLKKINYDLM